MTRTAATPTIRRRRRVVSMVLGTAILVACVDTTSPSGAASISLVHLPSPSVIIGDVMRDSTGQPAPISVTVYDGNGAAIAGSNVVFVSLDSSIRLEADGLVYGVKTDSLGARVTASVGSLQTAFVRIPVALKPDVVEGGGVVTTLTFPPTTAESKPADSLVQSVTLPVTVKNANGRGAQGIIVNFVILGAPTPLDAARPTTYVSDGGKTTARDTTDAQGHAARQVTFLHRRASGEVVAGTAVDTITVAAYARYLGADVAGSPIVFKIPVKRQ